MRSSFDKKHDIGRLTPENVNDLWILSDIIKPGDIVTGKTTRSLEIRRGEERVKTKRKPVVLTIEVEKVDFSERLRLGGKIVEGPEDIKKGYHTIEVKPGSFITVNKTWKNWEINKIKAAAKKSEPVFICILDESEADFYILEEKVRHLLHLTGGLGKGMGESKKPEYYGKILSELKKADTKKIIIAGPGFAKEEIQKLVKEKAKDISEKIVIDSLSHTGEVGLQELLKRGIIERIATDSRIVEETNIVEKLFGEIAKEGKVVYGLKETKQALEAGAVEVLLISDVKAREFEDLLEKAEKTRTKIMIISSQHQSGEKLLGMGGIAGFLRYKI